MSKANPTKKHFWLLLINYTLPCFHGFFLLGEGGVCKTKLVITVHAAVGKGDRQRGSPVNTLTHLLVFRRTR